jgi:preprotein translocase subunit SecE
MRPEADKALIYTIAVIVCAIIVWIVIFGIAAMLFGVM